MSNHPNRSKEGSDASNPTPEEIRQAREAAGLTQTEAGKLVYTQCRVWQQWEAIPGTQGYRRMHPAFWELFNIKTNSTPAQRLKYLHSLRDGKHQAECTETESEYMALLKVSEFNASPRPARKAKQ
jgi:hypothetical protein